ncbi:MAG: hypothetical protein HY512_03255 [Candidatus Aenigmarchaeota archaeon]|nr:hypothetical protein [Candidatus Aenigmarchaeota archaeon]
MRNGYISRALQSLGDAVGYVARPLVLGAAVVTAVVPGCATQRASVGKWFAGEEKAVRPGYTGLRTDAEVKELVDAIEQEMTLINDGLPHLALDVHQYLKSKEAETAASTARGAGNLYLGGTALDDVRNMTLDQLWALRGQLADAPELLGRMDRQAEAREYVANALPELRVEAARKASKTASTGPTPWPGPTQAEVDAKDRADLPALWNEVRPARGP